MGNSMERSLNGEWKEGGRKEDVLISHIEVFISHGEEQDDDQESPEFGECSCSN